SSCIFDSLMKRHKITILDVTSGRCGLFLTSPKAIGVSAFVVEFFVGTTSSARRIMEGPLAAGQMFRGGITVTPGPPLGLSAFEPSTVVTSVCAATAPGLVFASGAVDGRGDSIKTFARDNKSSPVRSEE